METINRPTDDRVIMGIDPGTNIMGYAFIGVNGNRARLIAMGVIDQIGRASWERV